jgi:hypothetical protein
VQTLRVDRLRRTEHLRDTALLPVDDSDIQPKELTKLEEVGRKRWSFPFSGSKAVCPAGGEGMKVSEKRAARYQKVKGLLQKFSVSDPVSGDVGGVFVFDSKAYWKAFRDSDLAKSTGETYRFTEPLSARVLEIIKSSLRGGDSRCPRIEGLAGAAAA